MLIIWDRLFGTFKAEDRTNPPVYGLVHPVKSFNPLQVQFHPWPVLWRRVKAAKGALNKLAVIFCGPGWQPGLSRLGDSSKIPRIVHPVQCYDPEISAWKNCYVVVHFAIILLFYHELTLSQSQFSPLLINVGVFSLILSITSIGLMLENKHPSASVYELARCISYICFRQYLDPIMDHGLKRMGANTDLRLDCLRVVHLLFASSLIISALLTSQKFLVLFWSGLELRISSKIRKKLN